MQMVINSAFKDLNEFIKDLPNSFENIPEIIQNHRNDIRICRVGEYKLVVKSFKGMYFPNKVAYTFFRKSKARRSYENSFLLLEKGFHVPDPVAYIDCYENGLLADSYFVSRYFEHVPFTQLSNEPENVERLLTDFATFTYRLHRAGVYHKDYSNGNILCTPGDHGISFSMVDLNRIRFGSVSFTQGVINFSRLALREEALRELVRRYCVSSGHSPANAFSTIIRQKSRREKLRAWRKRAKMIFFPRRVQRQTV